MDPITLISSLGPKVLDIVSELIPDKDKAKRASEKITQSVLDHAQAIAMAQIQLNTQEAQHRSVFVAGWRPAVGWVCVLGLLIQFIILPLANGGLQIFGAGTVIPGIDMGPLLTLLTGMLGFGALRTYEKGRGLTK